MPALAWGVAVLLLGGVISGPVRADGPTSRPAATQPESASLGPAPSDLVDPQRRAAQMSKWFADLASADGKLRDAARVGLMSLGRDDLPVLLKLVRDHRPLQPSQAVVLKEIVTQMFLAGDAFESNGHDGFLGIRPAEVSVGVRQPDDPRHENPDAQQPAQVLPNAGFPNDISMVDPSQVCGILVMERMPGFAGARSLQNGDVILGIVERPNVQLHGATEFSLAIRAFGAGQTLHFELLRQGQVVRVGVTLGPRPLDADLPAAGALPMQGLLNRRDKEASDYWEAEFAPLLEEGVG